eukprot:CAMPEP_0198299498 /NCGR_PEP_ID=MMETSP1449-20131203/44987_1 /TAXON_ID=420275 /ORGANISM="Attheya septentrionalis, Strain CCMP2084" /LENGTH=347 /DNA_ID=CAMNT_0044001073 /DNA_START=260 /DNA_END=1303 /DNA_ORIENTATION=-
MSPTIEPSRVSSLSKPVLSRTFVFPVLAVCAAAAAFFTTFENVADLNFFIGVTIPWKIWKTAMHMQLGDRKRGYEVRSCNEMHLIFTTHTPILFKKCISDDVSIDDLIFFKNRTQNLFPPCINKKQRNFVYQPLEGEPKDIVEDVPCTPATLEEKFSEFAAHNLTEAKDGTPSNAYFDVHTYMVNMEERHFIKESLMKSLQGTDLGLTSQMVGPVLTYFLSAGRSAVYYLHAHMDHFLSFCLKAEKTWTLIDPLYMDQFESVWSGNAEVMLKEKYPAHRLTIKQEKGDVLYVPPWWLHETNVPKGKKNTGFNIHFGIKRQITFHIADLVNHWFGDATFFYSSVPTVQ